MTPKAIAMESEKIEIALTFQFWRKMRSERKSADIGRLLCHANNTVFEIGGESDTPG